MASIQASTANRNVANRMIDFRKQWYSIYTMNDYVIKKQYKQASK